MKKTQDMRYLETNRHAPTQEQAGAELAQDTEPPPGPVAPEAPEPFSGPEPPSEQQKKDVKKDAKKEVRAETSYSKNKRKKTSLVDHENMFKRVQLAVANKSTPPPLIHTRDSLFGMLCDTFEKEFPNCLPQHMRDQCLSIIMNGTL
jgi:hypothetical protein